MFVAVKFLMQFSLLTLIFGKSVPVGKYQDSMQTQGTSCNPIPDPTLSHYIVAYGSLMEQASKDRTDKNTGENIPAVVTGFSRKWNLKGDGVGKADTTYLGVIPDRSSTFNGVIFQLNPIQNIVDTLQKYDLRESFYCRQMVDAKDIQIYRSRSSSNETESIFDVDPRMEPAPIGSQYWIYVNKPEFTADPNKEFPIVQSYVDIFLSGCLELQDKFNLMIFALNCVETTSGWNGQFWVNDRIFPRRPFVYQPKAAKIDKLLEDSVPREFNRILIEG